MPNVRPTQIPPRTNKKTTNYGVLTGLCKNPEMALTYNLTKSGTFKYSFKPTKNIVKIAQS